MEMYGGEMYGGTRVICVDMCSCVFVFICVSLFSCEYVCIKVYGGEV